ncbi:MAG TPA: DUF2946 family protein [Hydrogenophaga sp.]
MISHALRWWTRVLLAAMLLATLAPAISRTLSAAREVGDWVEICSAEGVRWVQVTAAPGPASLRDSQVPQTLLDDCGHCTLMAERFAPLLPTVPAWIPQHGAMAAPLYAKSGLSDAGAPSPGARDPPLLS